MMKKKQMDLIVTKKGLPALWERGGGYSNTGFAVIVAGPKGEKIRPIYIRRRGELACKEHALFVVKPGFWVIEADHHRRDFIFHVYRIEDIVKEGEKMIAKVKLEYVYEEGEWNEPLPEFLYPAVEAAEDKALIYHCRSMRYGIEPTETK